MKYRVIDKGEDIAGFAHREDAEIFLKNKRDQRLRDYTPNMIKESEEIEGGQVFTIAKVVSDEYDERIKAEITLKVIGEEER